MSRAVVLVSGGIDSATCLGLASQSHDEVLALSFDYGCKASERELACARALVRKFGAEYMGLSIVDFSKWGGSALTDPESDVPLERHEGVGVTYVPARNTIFLSIAASVAEAKGYETIYIGVHADDYEGYPDCRPEYIESMRKTLSLGMDHHIDIVTPLLYMSKAEIVLLSRQLGIEAHEAWSCYQGNDSPCGKCSSCRIRLAAEAEADKLDSSIAKEFLAKFRMIVRG